jgi:hypothetical protein
LYSSHIQLDLQSPKEDTFHHIRTSRQWSDKTLHIFDPLMQGIDRGELVGDYLFTLLEENNGKVVPVQYKGVWLMVDNGHLRKATAVLRLSRSLDTAGIRWSHGLNLCARMLKQERRYDWSGM